MGADDNGDFGFEQTSGNLLNCLSSGNFPALLSEKVAEATMSSMSVCKASSLKTNPVAGDSFLGTGWDPLVQAAQNVGFKGSMASDHQLALSPYNVGILESRGVGITSHLVRYPSDAGFLELAPRLSCFENASFSEIAGSFGLPECSQIANVVCPQEYPSDIIEKSSKNGKNDNVDSAEGRDRGGHSATNQEEPLISDDGTGRSLPKGRKRKRIPECHAGDPHSQFDSMQTVDVDQHKNVSTVDGLKEGDEKKSKGGHKVTSIQAKDHPQNGDSSKEDYIHVRARRGQATNSHSLAERVRREKISERMRFLQDLVPGCDKITGKAVMLDEIINYVQSLQRQVEFLSMKLATVNPELNFDIERLLSKDVLHSRAGGSPIFGFGQGMSSCHAHLLGSTQGSIQSETIVHSIQNAGNMMRGPNSQFSSMPQISGTWRDELQSIVQMGLVSSAPFDTTELHGCMKVEL